MTALLSRTSRDVPVGWIGEPRLLRGTEDDLLDHHAHLAVHGTLPALSREALLASLDAVGLAGRGGAGFPLARKIRALAAGVPVLVVNGAEGEPISAKDHALLARTPHLVLDGARAVAEVIGARRVLVAIADPDLAEPLRRALASRPDAGLFELRCLPDDRFIAGEAGALVAALNGAAGLPPGRRVLPTERGVAGRPTLLSNAETYAQLGVLARLGAARYGSIGAPGEPGSTLLTVSGAVASPGVLEVPLGSSLASVAAAVGAGPSQAVLIGGYHGSWLPPEKNLSLSRAGLAAAGGTLGAGVLAFVGSDTCALAELARVTQWLADQSAKQCGPCTFGLPALAADLRSLLAGQVGPSAGAVGLSVGPALARHASQLVGRGACAHPDGAVRFVRSGLATLAEEVGLHRAYGSCRRSDRGQLATIRPAALRGLS